VAEEEGTQWRQARREAAATLRSALGWSLPPEHWEQVRDVLAEVAAAVSAAAPGALFDATETLGLYMPVRVGTRLGDPAGPAPGFVREQIAELVDTLEPYEAAGQGGAGLPRDQERAARRGA
jgi:hypothetical protein